MSETYQDPYEIYRVKPGDSAQGIAQLFALKLESILANNPDVMGEQQLEPGENLIIPPSDGIVHFVRYGETLSDIAAEYGVDVEAILDDPANSIVRENIVDTQVVFVPNGEASGSVDPLRRGGLVWPSIGSIIRFMDPSHPLGIDIGLVSGSSVVAATSGTVIFAGGNSCCSYGLYVVIMSETGIETLYGQLGGISVAQGQQVRQGDPIGTSGCSGSCDEHNLHFEVIDNGVRVNPVNYLP